MPRRIWRFALLTFVVAALTGSALRFGYLFGLPDGVSPTNVRHAHSHLMLMGWTTPALMAIMAHAATRLGGVRVPGWAMKSVAASLALAIAAWACFLRWGYDSVQFGSAVLPPAAVISGLAIIGWYGFAAGFLRATRGLCDRHAPELWVWRVALLMLVVSSLGAWGEVVVLASHTQSEFWATACVRVFVDVFGEGWLLLGALGLLVGANTVIVPSRLRLGVTLVAVSAPFTFPLGMSLAVTPAPLLVIAQCAAALAGLGAMLAARAVLVPPSTELAPVWRLVRLALMLKGAALVVLAIPAVTRPLMRSGLYLPYLHLLFLVALSVGLFATAKRLFGEQTSPSAFAAASIFLVATLIPLTALWPSQVGGLWTQVLAFLASFGPVLVILAGVAFAALSLQPSATPDATLAASGGAE